MNHRVVSKHDWKLERIELLKAEKEFSRTRDALAARRRDLPWVLVEQSYTFEGPNGRVRLADLFDGRRQLIVNHFMFAPDWEQPCKSCSFWAEHYDSIKAHINQRDTSFVAVSRAPIEKLEELKARMGWKFPWVSSVESSFNYDFGVSFTPEQVEAGAEYNYAPLTFEISDLAGYSCFIREGEQIYHTYSTFARGMDPLNLTYQFLDITPLGRQEQGLEHTMAWVRLKDQYV